MNENKVAFGLKNVHYALFNIKDGVVTFNTPIPLPGAVELTFDPRGDLIEFYADDMLYYAASNNQGYDGTLSIATIPEQFAIDALGEELDEEDGVLNELADAKGKSFALLFEFDGDVRATRHVMFNCSASRPTLASKTKTNSAEPNTNELKFVSSPIDINGKRMVKTKTTTKSKTDIYNNWYKKVYTKVPVLPKGA
ncbi:MULTISPECIES: major tail protein [Bacillus]|uniref:major tail protein n=1 Tax=Bacillus TaxID=1386 RepID=UPI00080F6EBB|nr:MULTISPECIES: major tail protein [Bacillus cereus group]ANV70835.1 phage tail protein [Bacillus thuringiensis]MBZ8120572.1 phage tail protein [Bacillus thuringiensis]MEB8703663.1 phage tail protein [Bacillus cereus]MEC2712718.1 phage tail protein [Bacillus cereus]MEC2745181.1 phage tail protein [Bacillus cereus]